MTGSISALTIAAFSIQRYFAVCHPLRVQSVTNPIRRTLKIIGLVWIAGFAIAFPCLFVIKINTLWISSKNGSAGVAAETPDDDNNQTRVPAESDRIPLSGSEYCYFDENKGRLSVVYVQFSFWVSFLAPLLLIVVLYIRIVVSIQNAIILHATNTRGHRELSKRKAAVNMSSKFV